MEGQHIVSGGWTDDNLNTEFVSLSPDAPKRVSDHITRQRLVQIRLPLNPVYVEDVDGTEVLQYREADMVMGKLYKFKWDGEEFAARRSSDGVEILKFCPDEK